MPVTKAIPTVADAEKALVEIRSDFPAVYDIKTQEQYDGAADILHNVKSQIKQLDDLRKSMTRPIDDAKKAVMDAFRPKETQLKQIETSLKNGITRFAQEEERKRLALEAKLRDQQAREQARLEERARKAEEAGNEAKAEEILSRIPAVPVVVAGSVRPEGIGMRTTWKAEVVDFHALVKAAAEDPTYLAYLKPDEQALNAAARALKKAGRVAGVRFFSEQGVTARS